MANTAKKSTIIPEGAAELVELSAPAFDSSGKRHSDLYIAVNGVNYLIPAGKKVKVPKFVADEYNRSREAQNKFYSHREEMIETAAASIPSSEPVAVEG